MKKFIFLCFVITLYLHAIPFIANGQLLSHKYKNYDTSLVLIVIMRSNSLKFFFPRTEVKKYYNIQEHSFKSSHRSIIEQVNNYFSASKKRNYIVRIIDTWLSNDSILNKVVGNGNVQAEEILYRNSNTRFLFKPFLKTKEQTWESLSTWQSYEVYIAFMNYLEKLPREKINKLFSSLKQTASIL